MGTCTSNIMLGGQGGRGGGGENDHAMNWHPIQGGVPILRLKRYLYLTACVTNTTAKGSCKKAKVELYISSPLLVL